MVENILNDVFRGRSWHVNQVKTCRTRPFRASPYQAQSCLATKIWNSLASPNHALPSIARPNQAEPDRTQPRQALHYHALKIRDNLALPNHAQPRRTVPSLTSPYLATLRLAPFYLK